MFSPSFNECTVKCKIVRRGTGEDTRYVPDLPELNFGLLLVYCDNVNYYAYPLPAKTEGKDCICHVIYQSKDEEVMSKFIGNLGKGNDVCKTTAYKSLITTTVADVKEEEMKQAEIAAGNVFDFSDIEYKEEDANDAVPMWVFNEKGYEDK